MSMMPGSSRDRILELERSLAVVQGALTAATEQNDRLRQQRDQAVQSGQRMLAEIEQLRTKLEEARWDAMGEDL